jgi:hypothetical protein
MITLIAGQRYGSVAFTALMADIAAQGISCREDPHVLAARKIWLRHPVRGAPQHRP